MFYGGVFSVTSAIVRTLDCLTRHESIAQRMTDELRARLASGDVGSGVGGAHSSDGGGDLTSLDQCEWLVASLRESLRLLCPVPVFLRYVRPDRDVELGNVTLSADTPLIISSWRFHRAPDC